MKKLGAGFLIMAFGLFLLIPSLVIGALTRPAHAAGLSGGPAESAFHNWTKDREILGYYGCQFRDPVTGNWGYEGTHAVCLRLTCDGVSVSTDDGYNEEILWYNGDRAVSIKTKFDLRLSQHDKRQARSIEWDDLIERLRTAMAGRSPFLTSFQFSLPRSVRADKTPVIYKFPMPEKDVWEFMRWCERPK